MTSNSQPEKAKKPLIINRTSIAGMIIGGSALFLFLFFLGLDFFGGGGSPYTGIVTYFVLPIFLIVGLLLVIIGVILRRRRIHLKHPEAMPLFPTLDLNSPKNRRILTRIVLLALVFLLLSGVGSYRAYHFSDSVMFCGQTCHQVMEPEYTAYRNSPHARVACVDCHIGPGADWFVKSKLSGMYQIYATVFNKYPRPIPVPVKNLRPAQETCEQCHWPKQFYGAVQKENHHFLSDEQNTPWVIRLLIRVGGGDPTFAPVGGIHWHMSIENKIEYIATDKQRQNIAWIRKTDENGTVTVYESQDEPLDKSPESYEIRRMDCIDCHDRPTHIYRSPNAAVNLALQTRRIDPSLPYIKAKGVELLANEYDSTDVALQTISDELKAYYKAEYPDVYGTKTALIEAAIDELENIYRNNFFPYMKVKWSVYPDNVGHLIWEGCFRCHDERHVTKAGQTIGKDCDACHVIISQGTEAETAVSLDGLEFKHPVDIGEAWKETNCNECHTGAMP
ncbi:MAG: cytochrome C [Candidatus Abyssobacteria bacterium SURF_17]|uniref:Cytochrome C n=1 Tax=Candidatus Abyssobacteria bacterium SURF_17 TaxID=2093361 RepID=A0A419F5X9_9BACT|nr:MAG: cytochrome C [Candidatus Abyssubacteria bacterium SURF_17]